MAYKLLLVAVCVALVKAESDCNCENTEVEEKDLWSFLKQLSEDYPNPEDKDISSVIPGVLSPLLECNCLEKARRKRKIFPDVEVRAPKEAVVLHKVKQTRAERHVLDKHCPRGYMRIGILCLPENYDY